MPKVKVEIEVEVNEIRASKPGEEPTYEFVSLKVPGKSPIPLARDVETPRRLSRDLAEAAGRKVQGKPSLEEELKKVEEETKAAAAREAARGQQPRPGG